MGFVEGLVGVREVWVVGDYSAEFAFDLSGNGDVHATVAVLSEHARDAAAEHLALIVAVSAHGNDSNGDVFGDRVLDHGAVSWFENMERESDLGESEGVGEGEEVNIHIQVSCLIF